MDSKEKCQFNHLFYKLSFESTLELNYKFSKQFVKKSLFIGKYTITCVIMGECLFTIFHGYLLILAYIYDPDNSSIGITIFWWLWSNVAIKTSGALLLISFFFIYMVSYYLKLRVRQIYANFNYSIIFTGFALNTNKLFFNSDII